MAKPTGGKSGRPRRKSFPLTRILTEAGEVAITTAGNKQLARNRYLAERVWEILTRGRTQLLDGTELTVSAREWLDAVRWLYGHADPAQLRVRAEADGSTEVLVDLVPPSASD